MIVQPLLIIQERVHGNELATKGLQKNWMLGAGLLWNDPLKYNEIAFSFLTDVSKGVNYFSDVERASKDYDLVFNYTYKGYQPFSLGFNWVFQNINYRDTVTDFSQGIAEVKQSELAQVINQYNFFTEYFFDQNSFILDNTKKSLSFFGGYQSLGFNFYNLPFQFDSYQQYYLKLKLDLFHQIPSGYFLSTSYQFRWANLIRGSNSFTETFTINNNNTVKENFIKHFIQDFDFQGGYNFKIGELSHLKFTLSLAGLAYTHIFNGDSLNDFFQKPLILRGYPILKDKSNYLFKGNYSTKLLLDYRQIIWKDIYYALGEWFLDDFYFNLFLEAGFVSNRFLKTLPPLNKAWGTGFELSSILFYSFPLNFSIQLGRALQSDVKPIQVFNSSVYFTRLEWVVSFGI